MNEFSEPGLIDKLELLGDTELDALDFGVIKMDPDGRIVAYNRYESEAAGLSRERVLTRNFFTQIGPCTNNALIAGRFHGVAELDAELDYVFTLRMQHTPVRLRLLKSANAASMYLLVRR
jgi:photoactive yellow protein